MRPLVELVDVGLTYGGPAPVHALREVNLEVDPGDYVTVVGPSGSGKSTFLNVVGLLDRPTEGVYRLNGIDVSTIGEKQRTALRGQQIGFVFQSFHLMPYRSALENVTLAQLYAGVPRRKRLAGAEAALSRVGLAHRRHSLSNTLSGGERQRVAIARAVLHRPSLLLCDEPTGNLDSGSAAEVLSLLDDLNRDGMTVMVITHDSSVAERGGRMVTIRDGVLR